jgi:methyl acetate hydrolase
MTVTATAAHIRIDALLRAATDARDIPGVSAAAFLPDGTIYEAAFGLRDVSAPAAMTTDSVFWIASMTKAITSVAAMQLVEQGKLALDEPLGQLLPALAAPQVLEGFDANGEARLRPARRPVTLRRLLTHTAGYGYNTWNAEIGRYMTHHGLPGAGSGKNIALQVPLLFDPGDRWNYGINIDFVGKAVEAASGQSLEAYFKEHIFAPLGMTDTVFTLRKDQRARMARMHQRSQDGSLTPTDFEVPQNPEFFPGGGGLYGTARDYLIFTRMILDGGRYNGTQILKSETIAEMSRNQIGDLCVSTMRTAIPASSNDADFFPDMVQKWGLGFLINTDASPHGRSPGSLAWGGLGNTYYWVDPALGVSGVMLMQILPFVDARAIRLFNEFEKTIYAAA